MEEQVMDLLIHPGGTICCIYGEEIDLSALGVMTIRRASFVEPDEQGRWWVDLSPVGGPRRGPYSCRSQALAGEAAWLAAHLHQLPKEVIHGGHGPNPVVAIHCVPDPVRGELPRSLVCREAAAGAEGGESKRGDSEDPHRKGGDSCES